MQVVSVFGVTGFNSAQSFYSKIEGSVQLLSQSPQCLFGPRWIDPSPRDGFASRLAGLEGCLLIQDFPVSINRTDNDN